MREKKIELYKAATLPEIKELFNNLLFKNARRLNMKIYSKESWAEDRTEHQNLNAEFYAKHDLNQETIDNVR